MSSFKGHLFSPRLTEGKLGGLERLRAVSKVINSDGATASGINFGTASAPHQELKPLPPGCWGPRGPPTQTRRLVGAPNGHGDTIRDVGCFRKGKYKSGCCSQYMYLGPGQPRGSKSNDMQKYADTRASAAVGTTDFPPSGTFSWIFPSSSC